MPIALVDPEAVKITWRQKNPLFVAGIDQELFGKPTCTVIHERSVLCSCLHVRSLHTATPSTAERLGVLTRIHEGIRFESSYQGLA